VPAPWLEQPGPEVGSAALVAPLRHRVSLLVPAGGETPTGRLRRAALLVGLG
jgi:hypothetical protein